jgi:hypothetical protein
VSRTTFVRGRSYAVHGYLKPRHTAGTKAVKLSCYHRESGTWVLRKTVRAPVSDFSTYSKYAVRIALGRAGRWRLRAGHACPDHTGGLSAYHYVRVR